jgi:hypothetical protein
MTAKERINEIEDTCATLQTIAQQYPEGSKEFKAIELAANSMLFIITNVQVKQFDQYLQDLDREVPQGKYGQELR